MTNTIELEVAIKRARLTKRRVAKELGISSMGLYQKINNVTEFKASEISTLSKLLSIENIGKIFLDE